MSKEYPFVVGMYTAWSELTTANNAFSPENNLYQPTLNPGRPIPAVRRLAFNSLSTDKSAKRACETMRSEMGMTRPKMGTFNVRSLWDSETDWLAD